MSDTSALKELLRYPTPVLFHTRCGACNACWAPCDADLVTVAPDVSVNGARAAP